MRLEALNNHFNQLKTFFLIKNNEFQMQTIRSGYPNILVNFAKKIVWRH